MTMNRHIVLMLLIAAQGLCMKPVLQAQGGLTSNPGGLLTILLRTDKPAYAQGEEIKIEVHVANTGAGRLHLYELLSRGPSASLQLHIYDEQGREIQPNVFDDSIPPPPNPNSREGFIRLFPGYSWGTFRRAESLEAFGIYEPGRYTLQVEYHSPISRKWATAVDHWIQSEKFWATEDGRVWSEPVTIELTDK